MSVRSCFRAFQKRQNETLEVEAIDIRLPALPAAAEGFRIAIVSDLHITCPNDYLDTIAEAIGHAMPECILIAGDTMDETTYAVSAMMLFFQKLAAMAPTVAVLGNNDCLAGHIDALRAMYRKAGVVLLENETRLLSARGVPLQITGLMDPQAAKRGILPERVNAAHLQAHVTLPDALRPKKVEFTQQKDEGQAPSILLLHRPEMAASFTSMRPSLIVCGHAHGGQFRFGRVGGLYAPGQGFFPKLTGGLYTLDGGTRLVVSRGLGNHRFPLRMNNPPHIPVLTLRRA